MALGLAEIIILGLLVDFLFRKIRLPGLIGMMLIGAALGPCVLNYLQPELLTISADLRMVALIIILLRAGLQLSRRTLHRVGRLALLLSFVPSTVEGITITLLAPRLLGLTTLESAMLGFVVAAVSPAVVVPAMLDFIHRRQGTAKGIPTLLIAAASTDNVYVILVFTALLGIYAGAESSLAGGLALVPVSILTGIAAGILCGGCLFLLFKHFNPRATKRMLILLGVSIGLLGIQHHFDKLPFAALLAVMTMGAFILEKSEPMAHELSSKFSKLWVFAEIVLFTMVGAQVNLHEALHAGGAGTVLLLLALCARSAGTWLCLLGSNLTPPERLFVVVSYLPKATVQAAIGGVALVAMTTGGMDTRPGQIILAVAVLSIVLTAPLGAWMIRFTGNRVLAQDPL